MEALNAYRQLWWWVTIIAIACVGLALRIIAAHGGLWTDEAWSMIYAVEARDPVGVFLRINHDNNHHINTLWLQAVGIHASPFVARLPAIAAGSLSIIVAALLVGRRSPLGGIVASLCFAFAPAFLVFGSEARGYAMMLLAALLTLLLTGDELDGRTVRGSRWYLAALATFGMFSHMTMAAPVAIACLWFYLERREKGGPDRALKETARLMGPSLAASATVIGFVFIAAALSPTGLRLGGYTPFSSGRFVTALDEIALWSAGLSTPLPWAVPLFIGTLALFLLVRPPSWLGSRARLYALLIIAIPVGAAIVRPGNTGFARYYLTSAIGLLLLLAEWIALGLSQKSLARAAAALLLTVTVGISFYGDSVAIARDRGRPARPVMDLAKLSPSGTRLALGEPRLEAVVSVAAAEQNYPLHLATGCAPADFLLATRSRSRADPLQVTRCGVAMDQVDSSVTIPLTGDSWVLYRARTLQSSGVADSGPAPGAGNRRLFAERA